MSLVSVNFYIFVAVVFALYCILPDKYRWIILFFANILFFVICAGARLLGVALIPIAITYIITLIVDAIKRSGGNTAVSKSLVAAGVIIDVLVLISYKEINFFISGIDTVLGLIGDTYIDPVSDIMAPIGISYYTLTLISYLLDSYWGVFPALKNPFKYLTYILYFPAMTSGPIMRYDRLGDGILCGKRPTYRSISFGAQRIAWGLFKKLVIADRLAPFVSNMHDASCEGVYVFIGVIGYGLELYMDFSGCMDIVIGVSQCLGIELSENFNTPLFATTLSEYWRRWHITLGAWVRDYVMNPLLKSKAMISLGRKTKQAFGKKWGKRVPLYIGMFVTWACVGFWHGGAWTFILGSGLFFFAMIVMGQICEPIWTFLIKLFHINTKSTMWITWQRIRTFLLFCASISFSWSKSVGDAITLWKRGFSAFNPEVLINGDILTFGLDLQEMLIVIAALLLVLAVSNVQKHRSVREVIAGYNIIIRWIIYAALIVSIIVFGVYGEGYDAGDFIYGAF